MDKLVETGAQPSATYDMAVQISCSCGLPSG